MLTIEPALHRRAGRAKLAIALAGGGPLGFFYELGALHALSEAIEGRELTDFDIYVGVSSGSLIAAALASGFDTAAMCGMFLYDESVLFAFSPSIVLRPAFADHALIFSLGIGSIMNVPVMLHGRCLGIVNLSHAAGRYGEADVGPARILAGLLAPVIS